MDKNLNIVSSLRMLIYMVHITGANYSIGIVVVVFKCSPGSSHTRVFGQVDQ